MIRTFEKKDTERVMTLWYYGNCQAHPFVPENYWRSNIPMVQEQLLQAQVLVCEEDGEIRGFLGMMDNYIAGIFVDEAFRSEGVGKQLLDEAKQRHSALTLQVYRKNERAVRFYLREGFSISMEGTEEDTGETEYRMIWKELEG